MINKHSFQLRIFAILVIPVSVLAAVVSGLFVFDLSLEIVRQIALFGLLASLVFGVGFAMQISNSVRKVGRSAASLVGENEFVPVKVKPGRSGVLDRIAKNINKAGSTNTSTTKAEVITPDERERVRKGISEIVVNLARRSQSLLDRQVEVIDDLEQSEEDSERLQKLFKVDHLATRMRRTSESLLVLADAEPGKRRGKPVELSDVMRVAIGEVENYENIQLDIQANSSVTATAAVDLAHLLAELIENASHFSPPEQPVELMGRFNIEDDYVINVIDNGVGMSEEQMRESNELLANPPALDIGLGRSLGFSVVGRLAKRLGITVTLFPTPGSGVSAVVKIPQSQLLVSRAPERPVDAPPEPPKSHLVSDNGDVDSDKESLWVDKSPKSSAPTAPREDFKGELRRKTDEPVRIKKEISASPTIPNAKEDAKAAISEVPDAPFAESQTEDFDTSKNEALRSSPSEVTQERTDPFAKPEKPTAPKPQQAAVAESTLTASSLQEPVASQPKVAKREVPAALQRPQKLEEALPSGDAFDTGIEALLKDSAGPKQGLTKRKRGNSKIVTGESRRVAASSRKPEEIKSLLSQYRAGIKGDPKPANRDEDQNGERNDKS